MARVAVALSCEAEVLAELERLSRSRSGEVRMAERARIVLACVRGKRNDEVASEVLRGETTQTRKRADFQSFMDEVVADQPAERQIHVTPGSARWLDQVEIWFGIFQRKTLNGAGFRSTDQLMGAMHAFTAASNEKAVPFVWRKREVKGALLHNTIVDLHNWLRLVPQSLTFADCGRRETTARASAVLSAQCLRSNMPADGDGETDASHG